MNHSATIAALGIASCLAFASAASADFKYPRCEALHEIMRYAATQDVYNFCNNYSHIQSNPRPEQWFAVYSKGEVDAVVDALSARFDAKSAEMDEKLRALTGKLDTVTKLIYQRIDAIPVELTKNEKSYELLKQKLKTDIGEITKQEAITP